MLNNAQLDVLEKLSDPNSPRVVGVEAKVGAGMGTVIEHLVEGELRAAPSAVLLVVPNLNVIVQQWLYRLSDRTGITNSYPLSTAVALELLERGGPTPGSVIIAKVTDLRRPIAQRLLQTWLPSLVIVDGATIHTIARLADVIAVAQRAVIVGHDQPLGDVPIIATLEAPEPSAELIRCEFTLSAVEQDLMARAGAFTRANPLKQWHDAPDTRPSLMDRLLRIATARGDDDGVTEVAPKVAETVDRAWDYIDAVERLGADPRLAALDKAIDESGHTRVFVVAPNLADLDYVVQHLQSSHPFVEKIDARMGGGSAAAPFAPTDESRVQIVAGTPRVVRQITEWPDSVAFILWSRADHILDQAAGVLRFPADSGCVAVLHAVESV